MLDADDIANASVRWSRSRRGWQVHFVNIVPQDVHGLGGNHLSNSHSTRGVHACRYLARYHLAVEAGM